MPAIIDLTHRPIRKATFVHCHSCHRNVPLQEVFDGWDLGHPQDECPYCSCQLLAPLVPLARA